MKAVKTNVQDSGVYTWRKDISYSENKGQDKK